MPRDPEKLEAFQLAHTLVLEVYRLTDLLPDSERFGLQTQLRRAAVSIPANLVEGCARRSVRDYLRFVEMARGSAVEVRYLLALTRDLGFLSAEATRDGRICSDRVARALHGLQQAIECLPS